MCVRCVNNVCDVCIMRIRWLNNMCDVCMMSACMCMRVRVCVCANRTQASSLVPVLGGSFFSQTYFCGQRCHESSAGVCISRTPAWWIGLMLTGVCV